MYVTFNAEQVRSYSFSLQEPGDPPKGQQISCWLPSGKFKVIGREKIIISEFGKSFLTEGVRLEKGQCVFYVHPNSMEGTGR